MVTLSVMSACSPTNSSIGSSDISTFTCAIAVMEASSMINICNRFIIMASYVLISKSMRSDFT